MKELTITLNEKQINRLREEFRDIKKSYLEREEELRKNSFSFYGSTFLEKLSFYWALARLQEFDDIMNMLGVNKSELLGDIK